MVLEALGRSARRPSCGRARLVRAAPGASCRPRSRTPWCWSSSRRRSRAWGPTGGFEFLIEDREGRGVEAAGRGHRPVPGRGRGSGPSWPALFTPFSARVPQLRFDLDRVKARSARRAGLRRLRDVLQANLGGYYVNDFNLYGKTWKVYGPGRADDRRRARRHPRASRSSTARETRCPSAPWAT